MATTLPNDHPTRPRSKMFGDTSSINARAGLSLHRSTAPSLHCASCSPLPWIGSIYPVGSSWYIQ